MNRYQLELETALVIAAVILIIGVVVIRRLPEIVDLLMRTGGG